jgi:peptidylprolyl isomerase
VTDDVQDRTLADAPDEAGSDPGADETAATSAATTSTAAAGAAKTTPGGSTPAASIPAVRRPSPATVRRQAKKEAARRAAEARRRARRRRQAWSYASIAAVVVIVLVGGYLWLGRGDGKPSSSASLPAGCPSAGVAIDPALCSRPTVTKGAGTLSELKVTPLVTGTGPKVAAGQWITVNYTGVNYGTGTQFDSSWSRSAPTTFQIGTGAVIKGWDQGIVGQTVGSRLQLDIPGSLAYPDATPGSDTAGDLRFVVDILAVSDTSPPAAAGN